MPWRIVGQMMYSCSCKMACPCTLGPAKPDEGWCSGAIVVDIQEGESDGVSLKGTKAVWALDLPGDFFSGGATSRLYIDEGVSAEQRRELETILTGKKGGGWEALGALTTKWLPSKTARIEIQKGDTPTVVVGGVGRLKLQPVKTEDGRQVSILNSPAIQAFGADREDLARGDGSSWSDSDMRRWESGGAGAMSTLNMSS